MTLTYCGIFLNIMVVLLHMDTTTNEYNDLVTLQKITRDQDNDKKADIDSLLKTFREQTHLRVSLDDLYVYFSNMGVFKI